MNVIKYVFKLIFWSAAASILLRILFGLYSVFGPVILIPTVALGVCTAFISSTAGIGKFTASSLFHILFTVGFYVISDFTYMLRMIPKKSGELFAKIFGIPGVRINIVWCILFVSAVYFTSFLICAVTVSSVKTKRIRDSYASAEDQYEDDWYEDPDEYNDPDDRGSTDYVKIYRRK